MGDISLAAAASLPIRAWPFLLLRAAVWFGIAAAFAVAAAGGAGIGLGLAALAGATGRAAGAFWGAVGGLAFVAILLRSLREYLLYLVEASHAVALLLLIEPLRQASAPAQIPAAMTALQRRFRDVTALAAAERTLRGALGDMIRAFDPFAAFLPNGVSLPRNLSGRTLAFPFGFVAKALLARTARLTARNPYTDLQDSVILLAQNHEVLLRNAALLAAASATAGTVLFFLSLVPAFAIVDAVPGGSWPAALVLAFIFAWSVRLALIEPFVIAAFLELYLRVTTGQSPDPAWDMRLSEVSASYRELQAIAAPAIRGSRRGVVV